MIYLDNAATTKVSAEAIEEMSRALNRFGNPASSHSLGLDAKNHVKEARKKIEKILNAEQDTLYFTSGATESNNWAVFGAARANQRKGRQIITAKTEHPSVLEPIKALEKSGFEIRYVNPGVDGTADISHLEELMSGETILVSLMHVNNETGAINDIERIGRQIKSINSRAVFHVDAVASFCKIPINLTYVDLASVSGHKIHAPKGIGALYIKKGTKIDPLIMGGGQQGGMRSGTENTPGIAALAASSELLSAKLIENYESSLIMKTRMINGLAGKAEIIGAKDKNSSPFILTAGFRGIKSQTIINALEERGIFASSGSACSSNNNKRSKVLESLGIDGELSDGSVRFSFSRYNTIGQIDSCLGALDDIIRKYRG
jgi:cysteine desulfurase